jgi:hypothetical protein
MMDKICNLQLTVIYQVFITIVISYALYLQEEVTRNE